MKKVIKISVFLFLAVAVLAVCLFFLLRSCEKQKQEAAKAEVFDRAPLDEASVFGDYVFERKIRETTGQTGNINLSQLADITELDLSFTGTSTDENNKIVSLQGLRYFPNLKKLIIDRNMCSSFSGIESCLLLEYLSAEDCRFVSASPLQQLTKLTYLSLKNNEIVSTAFLKTLTSLEVLNMSGCPIKDFEVLSEVSLTKLKELDIATTSFTDMEWIYLLSGLERLDISGNELNASMIVGIDLLTNLQYLKASSQSIEDVSVFKNCKQLKTLILDVNRVTDLTPLSGLENLEELNVNSNLVEKVDCLADMKALKRIYAKSNQIKSYAALDSSAFESSDFSDNPITK